MDLMTLTAGYRVPIKNPENQAEIIKCEILRINQEHSLYYIHFYNLNRRYDKWVHGSEFILTDDDQIDLPKKKKKGDEKKLATVIDEEVKVRNFNDIVFGNYQINTWYFSPYPKDVIKNRTVFICEFCLFYFSTQEKLNQHCSKCTIRSPPGLMVYHDTENDLAFFEIDGYVQVNYCRNLALLSKLFLDHKSLIYDVDAFLFYILCKKDNHGCHIVGYFSKEKVSEMGYNLACILTLPSEQRKGYGKILIDFSYMLSKKDGLISGPEKPLSDLGLLSYRAYWLEMILESFKSKNELMIKHLSKDSHIAEDDIIGTLLANKMIKYHQDNLIVTIDEKCKGKMESGRKHRVYEKYNLVNRY
ncbi:MYST2 [Enterospora canceri]|uniref:histone acetyltransferase n=1 Tax=Enterospora canceri TaxID=1081671 RepID=A0A1Y1S8H6_9MICR|nr:MYST2 [Enterospora canceri]